MQPLVSVIVPVYNVEACLARCLDSLSRQSLYDIEILLIDDASPDCCGEICEAYAKKDSRFRVFHNKTNQGLSVARNIGIENATSDYLMFVDSDDYVHEDFCKESYETAVNNCADLVMFKALYLDKNGSPIDANFKKESFMPSGLKTRLEAMELLQRGVGQNAWNKLYHKDLFRGISYPPGYWHEDMGTTYKIVWKSSQIYYIDKVLYFKCYRKGSITTQKNEKLLHDWLEMYFKQYFDLKKWGYPSDKLDEILINIALLYCIKKKPDTSDANYLYFTKVISDSKSFPSHFIWEKKVLFLLFKYCRPLFELACVLFDKKVC